MSPGGGCATPRPLRYDRSSPTAGGKRVRTLHRESSSGRRPCTGRGARPQAQLHRHRAHPARTPARGGGPRRARARVARHHRRRGPGAGRADRRPGRRGHDRPDPVHPAREEGARAGAARGALPRPQLHRHGAHPARPRARERGRRGSDPARLRRRRREDPQRDHPHALRPRPPPAGRRWRSRREVEELEAPRPVRPQPDQAGGRGQARPGGRAPDRDRARDADPLAPHQEQPRAHRRARRRQDRRRRGPRRADLVQLGARAAEGQADLHTRPGRARGGVEVPRRVRGAPEEGDEGDHPARRHHPVHRRAAQPRRRRRGRGRDRRGLDPEAGPGARRAADDRRDHPRRVPQVPRARRGPRAALPADPRRRADGGRHGPDPARPARPLRGAPPLQDLRRRSGRGRDPQRPLHPGPSPARQGDRPDRRGRLADADQDDDRAASLPGARGRDREGAQGQGGARSRPRSSRRPPRCATRSASSRRRSASSRRTGAPRRAAPSSRRSARRRSPTSSRCGRASRSSS